MEFSHCKIAVLIVLLQLSLSAYASTFKKSSPMENQIWWSKKIRDVQKGCAGMCCSGKNSTCFGTGPKMGSTDGASGKCFCDESCLEMGDCCEDYSVHCEARNCEVGEWEDYGSCSKPCGLGAKTRTREVVQEPRNGGQECPALKETTVCVGTRCKSQRHLGARGRADRETARIMPATFGQFRGYTKYNAHMDIRKNLFYKYYSQRAAKRKGYCATFEITSSRRYCLNSRVPWAGVLRNGASICVECQPKAMSGGGRETCVGHGSTQQDTFWTAVNAHGCHGWWRRVNDLQECSCNNNNGLDFIFV